MPCPATCLAPAPDWQAFGFRKSGLLAQPPVVLASCQGSWSDAGAVPLPCLSAAHSACLIHYPVGEAFDDENEVGHGPGGAWLWLQEGALQDLTAAGT